MIYTVTFNPAVDYVMSVSALKYGEVNRSAHEEIFFGGKGINVSRVLKALDVDSCALGFTAGFTGKAVEAYLAENGINTDFIYLGNGCTRINVKLKADETTEINGQGPEIPKSAVEALFAKLDKLCSGDYLVLAGSVPSSLPDNIYERIMARISGRGVNFVVDASNGLLLKTLCYKPFLIKPNNFELGEIFGRHLSSEAEIAECARELQKKGAVNVLVSMAGDGSILCDENGGCRRLGAAKGEVINPVGAGDSMVAGFLAGFIKSGDYAYAHKLGTAAGGATAFSYDLADKNMIENVFNML